MRKTIVGILLVVWMFFAGCPFVRGSSDIQPLWLGDEIFVGQTASNPIKVRGDSMGFEISDTVNTFEWSLHKFYPDTIHFLLHLERQMPVLITTLGSEIRHTSLTVTWLNPDGGREVMKSSMTASDYMEMVKMGQAWDYDLCHEDQAMFNRMLPAGDFLVEVHGLYTQEQGTSNGQIITTFIGQFGRYGLTTPIPQFLLFGMPYKPWPTLSELNTLTKSRIEVSRYVSQEYLVARREYDGNIYFGINVPVTLDVTFSTRGYPTVLTVTGDKLHGDTIFCGREQRVSQRLAAGRYLVGVRDSIRILPDTYVSFIVESQPPPDWLKYSLRDPAVEASNYVSTITALSADGLLCIEDRKYFDGIGREVLDLAIGGSPSGGNIATLSEYDSDGRPSRHYLPGISSGNYVDFNSIDFSSVYGSNGYCYQQTTYDNTPLNRISTETGAGSQWHRSGISIRHDYDLNRANKASHAAFRYVVTDTPDSPGSWPTISCAARYGDSELYIHTVTDEDSRTVLEFNDSRGRRILQRADMADGTWADTYYLYDTYGNLTAVLPPEASARMASFGTWNGNTDETLTTLAFLYRFDHRGRMIARQEPGPVIEEYGYDPTDQKVLSRDGNLAAQGLWRFEICDNFGRKCLVGLCKNLTWDGSQTGLPMPAIRASRCMDASDSPLLLGYEPVGCVLEQPQVLEAFYYDDYSFVGSYGCPTAEVMGFSQREGYGSPFPNARGRLTGHAVAQPVEGSDSITYLFSATYYDSRDRAIQTVSTNHLGGIDRTLSAYDFAGREIRTETIHTSGIYSAPATQSAEIIQQWQRSFDTRGRQLTVAHRLGRESQWHTLSERSYDAIGRLASENRGGVTSTAYGYDIRSRMTSIRSRYYKQSLDYTPGGNISRMSWSCYCPDDAERTYQYSYDALGRLTAADYDDAAGHSGAYSTAYSYDLNGNILSLSRMGIYDRGKYGWIQYGLVDQLSLTYSGNRLLSVSDECSGPYYQGAYHFVDGVDEAVEYTYDANGNTDADLNRGIVSSRYDINNRPQSIDFADGSRTSYLYDAAGRKLRTIHEVASIPVAAPSVGSSPTEVVRSVTDYCGAIVYEDSLPSRINLEGGYLSFTDAYGNRLDAPQYHTLLTDHLGNNRMDLTDDGGVWQAMDYYPFGLPMASSYRPGNQRWLFGDKELDRTSGLDLYDQEARAYDPTLGRFRNPDPLAASYTPLSPYLFCAANPTLLIDPDGKKVELFATTLPGASEKMKNTGATHTFIVVTDSENVQHYFAYGAEGDPELTAAGFGGHLKKMDYPQDHAVYSGKNTKDLKNRITVDPPDGMTQDEFDQKVIETADSFGENEGVKYRLDGGTLSLFDVYGNCNTSTSTILSKSGVKSDQLKKIKEQIPGYSVGFSTKPMPWTKTEQKEAVDKVNLVKNIILSTTIPGLILKFFKQSK